eukprot:CAMPEP_0204328304 /NCGR_PEP_ID=MMETSP0469-20131031/13265_1 /ASSEMBLY_ACC=CAM_ASM_000384 /TAXON_ID=2969 /ORGANISM="Oxyrrhis marina" /LENGTH=50 /DNA_ID=CAMNT_0051310677 /DNA_START=16 /DNA_END=166 /DNA_ORIENTATION=+
MTPSAADLRALLHIATLGKQQPPFTDPWYPRLGKKAWAGPKSPLAGACGA